MKVWYDRKTRSQSFEVGDQVLILLPVVGSPLEAQFSGPYRIEKKVGNVDYIVSTPDRRKKYRLCHINMTKPFHDTYDESKRMVESRVVGCAVLGSDPSHADDHKQSRPVGQLENSQILEDLEGYLSHLTAEERTDMVILLNEFRDFFF